MAACSRDSSLDVATYYSPSEVLTQKAGLSGRKVKVYGRVAEGSLMHRPGTPMYRFEVRDDRGSLPVIVNGILPPQLAEGREVSVEGRLGADGAIQASRVLTKCPSKYRGRVR